MSAVGDVPQWISPQNVTVAGLLLAIVWALLKGHMVSGRELAKSEKRCEEETARADKWERLSLRLMETAGRATEATKDAVKVAEKSLDVVTRNNEPGGGPP